MTEKANIPAQFLDASREHLAEKQRPLRDNSLDGFRNGAILDLRVRLAAELLTHSPTIASFADPKQVAVYALNVATELFAEAEARGLIEAFDTPADRAHLKAHVERQTNYAMEQQRESRRQAEQSVQVGQAVKGVFRPN